VISLFITTSPTKRRERSLRSPIGTTTASMPTRSKILFALAGC
jgi:hypothetical protein